MRFEGLPGYEVVAQGRDGLAAGHESVASLLLCAGAVRLRALGVAVPVIEGPEHRLCACLAEAFSDGRREINVPRPARLSINMPNPARLSTFLLNFARLSTFLLNFARLSTFLLNPNGLGPFALLGQRGHG